MLAPLARLTLMVIAVLLISFVDETFEAGAAPDASETARTLSLSQDEFIDDADDMRVSIDRIGQQQAGADAVELRARAGAPGLACAPRITYVDGDTDSLDDGIADLDGVCWSVFAGSDRASVVGPAEVDFKVTGDPGADEGEATQTFTVK